MTDVATPPAITVLGDLAAARAAFGGGPAVLFTQGPPLDAAALDARADALAAFLAARGVGPGERVILAFRPGPKQLAALLACWKLGALVSPVDRFLTAKAFAHLLGVFAPRAILLGPDLERREIFAATAESLGLAVLDPFRAPLPDAGPPDVRVDPHALALCLFTSGSTGLPKGVLLDHAALLAGAANLIRAKGLGPGDRALCVLPLSHMNGLVTTFLSPLLSGGSVVYLQESFSPRVAVETVDAFGCTWLSAVPTHYTLMLAPPLDRALWSLATLRFCRSASAPLPPRILREFEAHYGVPVIETMGTTETAGQIFSNPLPPRARKPGAVGLPVGFRVRLVGPDGPVAAADTPGELQLQGEALMRGYLDASEETAKAFDGPWFRTGDIAVRDGDGYYFIRGRTKEIAIFCGVNVSLRAIESAIHEQGLLLDVACRGETHPIFGETVSVFAIPKAGQADYPALAQAVRDCAVHELPNAQALRRIRFVAAFPRSGAGKVLKGRLDEVEPLYSCQEVLPAAPAALLASVLGIPPESVSEDMAMGLVPQWDSLGYVALLAAVETHLGRPLNRRETSALLTFAGLRRVMAGELAGEAGARAAVEKPARELVKRLLDAGYGASGVTYLLMGFEACVRKGVTDVEGLLDALLAALPAGGSLAMNAFTWDFCSGKSYHHRRSQCRVGLINELFRLHPGVARTPDPIYSYAVYGPEAAAAPTAPGATTWGEDSMTWWLLEDRRTRVVTYGLPPLRGSLLQANPALHALEERFAVPYRYFKTFKGMADFGRGYEPHAVRMFVRSLDPDARNDWRCIADALEGRGLVTHDETERLYAYDNCDILRVGLEILSENRLALLQNPEDFPDAARPAAPEA